MTNSPLLSEWTEAIGNVGRMIVYKYVTADRIDVLRNRRIRFTQPAALNDPFEVFPDFNEYGEQLFEQKRAYAEKAAGKPMSENVAQLFRAAEIIKMARMREHIGESLVFLSLSKIKDNLLMWSHYANSHRGFVIGFDSENDFLTKKAGDVSYSEKRIAFPRDGLQSLTPEQGAAFVRETLYTKSAHWSYEQEIRVFAETKNASATKIGPDGHKIYLFDFPAECLKQIIFGCEMSHSVISDLVDLVKSDYPHVVCYQAVPDTADFKVGFVHFPLDLTPEQEQRLEALDTLWQD